MTSKDGPGDPVKDESASAKEGPEEPAIGSEAVERDWSAVAHPLNPWIWPGLLIVLAAILGWRVGDVTLVRSLAAMALLIGLLITYVLPKRRVLGLVWSLVVAVALLALLPWLDSIQHTNSASTADQFDLSRVNLSGADLRGVSLSGAVLRGTVFDNACMAGADLSGADLSGASFLGTDLTNAIWDEDAESQAAHWPTANEVATSTACR